MTHGCDKYLSFLFIPVTIATDLKYELGIYFKITAQET